MHPCRTPLPIGNVSVVDRSISYSDCNSASVCSGGTELEHNIETYITNAIACLAVRSNKGLTSDVRNYFNQDLYYSKHVYSATVMSETCLRILLA